MCFWKRKVPADQSPTRGVQPGLKEDSGRFAEIDRSLARDTAIGRRKRMLVAAILVVLAVVVVGLGTYFSHRFVERSRATVQSTSE